MGQKYQVIGPFPIARPGLPDAMPADPAAGRAEGDIFDVDELDPRTRVDLIHPSFIKPVDDKAAEAKKPAAKAGGK